MSSVEGLAAILSADIWSRLISAGAARVFEPGRVLMQQGEVADHVVVILDGRVKVTKVDVDGNTLVVAIRGAGELVGELALLREDHRRTATVTALDWCSTRIIALGEFSALARERGLDGRMLRHVAQRLVEAEDVRADLAVVPAGQRVVKTLLRLAVPRRRSLVAANGSHRGDQRSRGNGHIDVGISQSELAVAAGVHRSTAADELRTLREDGVVQTARGRIIILDLARLRERADE